MDYRVHVVMHGHGMSHREAREYISRVDRKRDRWSRFLYNVDWRDLFYYDVLVNISQTGLNHAADRLVKTARQEAFRFTAEAHKALHDMRLASRAQFALVCDKRTRDADFMVNAADGELYVVGRASEAEVMPVALEVLSAVDEIKTIRSSVADSRILFLQDRFLSDDKRLADVERMAERLDGAVQFMQLAGPDAVPGAEFFDAGASHVEEPGIEVHDLVHPERVHPEALRSSDDPVSCTEKLARSGRSAGVSRFYGTADWLLSHLEARGEMNMIVLGDLFVGRGEGVRLRLREQLARRFANRLRIPVLSLEEISQRSRFTVLDTLRLLLFGTVAAFIIVALWSNQAGWLSVLTSDQGTVWRLVTVASVLLLTLLFAGAYGSAVKLILRLVRFE
jgi:hypothetical protein